MANRENTADAPTNARSFKNLVNSHPIFVLLTFLVSTAGITAGVVQWFATKSAKLLQQTYEINIKGYEINIRDYEINIKDYENNIKDLESRLASIRIGAGTDKLLLNVKDIQIARTNIRSLSPKYRGFEYNGAPGQFYVSVPELRGWSRRSMTSMERTQEQFPDISIPSGVVENILTRDKWVVWQSPQQIEVSVQDRGGANVRMILAPSVAISKMSYSELKAAIKDIDDTLLELQVTTKQRLSELVALLGRDSSGDRPASVPPKGGDGALNVDRTMDLLSVLYSGDMAAIILSGNLMGRINFAVRYNGKYNLEAVEKKGNVLYLKSVTRLNVEEQVNGSEFLYLDQDVLIIGVGDHAIVIEVNVPSRNSRSDAYAWTRAWLTGLRLPIEPKSVFRSQVE